MATDARGPAVPDTDTLHRVIVPKAAAVWFPDGVLSSVAFNYPVFSTDVARLIPSARPRSPRKLCSPTRWF